MLALLSGRPGRYAAQAAMLTAVIGASVAYAAANKSITINIDGSSTKVHAFSSNVEELLDSQDIKVGDRDSVAPALNASIGDGDTVVVRYARPLTLTIDGKKQTYWTTATSVEAALQALGVRTDGAALSASRSEPLGRQGLSMWLSTPKDVVLSVDGHNHPITTTAPTVDALLATQGVSMDSNDKLSRGPATVLTDGLIIKLTRIDSKRITASETIAFRTVTKKNSKMYVGDTKVITAGKSGKRTVVYALTLADGKVMTKKAVTTTVLKQPVAQVEEVGTKKKPVTTSSGGGGSVGGSVASLNWSALAKCESGGNPNTNTGNGYYGLYQFSSATWHAMGGSGLPSDNSSSEQTYRAQLLYKKAGVGSWPSCGHHLYD